MKKLLPVLFVLVIAFSMASCDPAAPPAAAPQASPAVTASQTVAPAVSAQSADLITLPRAATGEFKTPEDALKCFADSIRKNDFIAATKAFPIYEVPEHLDYKAYADWLKVTYMIASPLPEPYKGLNTAMMFDRAENSYKSAVLCLCGVDPTQMIVQKSADDTGNFITAISPDKLSVTSLASQNMVETLSADMKNKHLENMAKEAKVYGADECRAYVVELTANGHKADCDTFLMLKYGANWYCLGGAFELPQ